LIAYSFIVKNFYQRHLPATLECFGGCVNNACAVGRCLSVLLGSHQLTDKYEQLRLQVVDFHVSVLSTCLQHADHFTGLAGDLIRAPVFTLHTFTPLLLSPAPFPTDFGVCQCWYRIVKTFSALLLVYHWHT